MRTTPRTGDPRRVGRYELHDKLAAGGMATVHLGRLVGANDVGRIVAIKRMHPHLAGQRDFAEMFLDEAKIHARIRHPNVVGVLEVISEGEELFIVMEYVHGASLATLLRTAVVRAEPVPNDVVAAIAIGVLSGLHAAHEATSEAGQPLGIVHRDVSPHNVMVGADGLARIADFGIAKAEEKVHKTQRGEVKGKLAYMAPEQLTVGEVDRRADVWSASVVLWEMLTGTRLFRGEEAAVLHGVLEEPIAPPSSEAPGAAPFDAAVLRGLERDPTKRFATALEMVEVLEAVGPVATPRQVAKWASRYFDESLRERAALVARIETLPGDGKRGHDGRRARGWLIALAAVGALGASAAAGAVVMKTMSPATTARKRNTSANASAKPPPSVPPTVSEIVTPPPVVASTPVSTVPPWCSKMAACASLQVPDPKHVPVGIVVEQAHTLARTLDPAPSVFNISVAGETTGRGADMTSEYTQILVTYHSASGPFLVAARGEVLFAERARDERDFPGPLPMLPGCPFETAHALAVRAGLNPKDGGSYAKLSPYGIGWTFTPNYFVDERCTLLSPR